MVAVSGKSVPTIFIAPPFKSVVIAEKDPPNELRPIVSIPIDEATLSAIPDKRSKTPVRAVPKITNFAISGLFDTRSLNPLASVTIFSASHSIGLSKSAKAEPILFATACNSSLGILFMKSANTPIMSLNLSYTPL